MSPPGPATTTAAAPTRLTRTQGAPDDGPRGTAYGLAAYGLWGLFPLYFQALLPAGALEVLAHRVIWSVAICCILVVVVGGAGGLTRLARTPRTLLGVVVAGLLIAGNWTIYTFAVLSGQVTEAALGYFLNPLVTVALGVLVLRERLRPLQWAAVGVGAAAGAYLTIDYGSPPWIALSLAASFAAYGLVKKQVGGSLSAAQSLTAETLVMTPLAVAILVYLGVTGSQTFTTEGVPHSLLLASAGLATTVPLLLFAGAARRMPLTTMGLLQFITPVLQLGLAVTLLGESMPVSRWVGFALVWVALALLTLDGTLTAGRARRDRRERRPAG